MKKLQKLKIERKIASKLMLLPFHVTKMLDNFYIREVDEIERYGAENPDVDKQSVEDIAKIASENLEDKKERMLEYGD